MGLRHARVMAAQPNRFALVGAYDMCEERRPPPEVARLRSEAEAIALADAVVVATSIDAHGATVARALAAGRHVLVEKPLCASAAEAQELASTAARGPARLFVGHSERFNPVVRALAKLVRGEGAISIDLVRAGPTRPSEHGVLLNLGVHDLDLAAYLGGGGAVLRGAAGGPSQGLRGDDEAHVVLTTAGGTVAHVHVDRTVPERRRKLVLATPCWIYEGDLLAHRLVRVSRETGARTEVPLLLEEPLTAQAGALADALDGGPVRELATGIDGARAVELAEHAADSCASAAPLAQPSSLRGWPR
jgi:predicted dehydrogenase